MNSQRNFRSVCWLSLSLAGFAVLSTRGQDETPFTRLFDTGAPSTQPLAAEVIAQRAGWTLVPEDKVDHPFAGDAVLLNDKLAVALRKQGRGAEVYAKAAGGLKHRATLGHVGESPAMSESLDALKIIENTSSSVMIEAASKGAAPITLRFRLTTGESILEVRPGAGAGVLRVQSQTRYVVVPDYFGDDMVFEIGTSLSPSEGERDGVRGPSAVPRFMGGVSEGRVRGNLHLPAENLCLNLLDGGDAILMTVWQSSAQDAWLAPPPTFLAPSPPPGERAGVRGRDRPVSDTSLQVQCLPGKSMWLAFLESPGLWHAGTVAAKADWKPPFPAKWRCSLMREHGVADSWEWERGLVEKPRPLTPSLSPGGGEGARRASEGDSGGGTGTSRHGKRAPNAPLLIYPLDRSAATPLTAICPTDVMRNTLGVGPCQYILACEGMAAQGDPTPNSVMGWVEKQFEQKKDRKSSDDIQERLDVMVKHVAEARAKIEGYAGFARQVRKVAAGQPGAGEVESILADLERVTAAGLAATATPQRARQLSDGVTALIGKENALAACQRLGEQLRSLGAAQDGALARSRMAVRRLKQQGRTLSANQVQASGVNQEVRQLAEQMLNEKCAASARNPGAKP